MIVGRAFFGGLLLIVPLLFSACKTRSGEQSAAEQQSPITASQLSDSFTQSFAHFLGAYDELRRALVSGDTTEANAAATGLMLGADKLRLAEIEGDTTGTIRQTAEYFVATISGSAKAIPAETDINGKRREFNMISDALWSLTRTVRFHGSKVYYHYCSSALNDAGGYWLSTTTEAENPYGSTVKDCGELTDSLDYSTR